jgi:hypothetical protein
VSEELKAANTALIERCKALLSEAGFRDFKEQSGAFMQGGVTAGEAAAVVWCSGAFARPEFDLCLCVL